MSSIITIESEVAEDGTRRTTRYDIDFPSVFENEAPARQVTLSDFRMDQYEVTLGDFEKYLAANPRQHPTSVFITKNYNPFTTFREVMVELPEYSHLGGML